MVDRSLGQHRVVLQLRLAERRGVAGDEDQLGLARAEGYSEGTLAGARLKIMHTQKRIQQTHP